MTNEQNTHDDERDQHLGNQEKIRRSIERKIAEYQQRNPDIDHNGNPR